MGKILKTCDAAKLLCASKSSVIRWIRQEGLPAVYHDSGAWLLREADVIAWSDARRTIPVSAGRVTVVAGRCADELRKRIDGPENLTRAAP